MLSLPVIYPLSYSALCSFTRGTFPSKGGGLGLDSCTDHRTEPQLQVFKYFVVWNGRNQRFRILLKKRLRVKCISVDDNWKLVAVTHSVRMCWLAWVCDADDTSRCCVFPLSLMICVLDWFWSARIVLVLLKSLLCSVCVICVTFRSFLYTIVQRN